MITIDMLCLILMASVGLAAAIRHYFKHKYDLLVNGEATNIGEYLKCMHLSSKDRFYKTFSYFYIIPILSKENNADLNKIKRLVNLFTILTYILLISFILFVWLSSLEVKAPNF